MKWHFCTISSPLKFAHILREIRLDVGQSILIRLSSLRRLVRRQELFVQIVGLFQEAVDDMTERAPLKKENITITHLTLCH